MIELDRHLLVCEPVPPKGEELIAWRRVAVSIGNLIINLDQKYTPWEMCDVLLQMMDSRRLGSGVFGERVARVLQDANPEWSGRDGLLACVSVMVGTLRAVTNNRLTAKAERRDRIAVGLWSALTLRGPLAESRLEELRSEVLRYARRAALEKASRERIRSSAAAGTDGATLRQQTQALRNDAVLDREEISVLRWVLADESSLLCTAFSDVERRESAALARGLELGIVLRRFPTYEHYELATRGVANAGRLSLGALVDAVRPDLERLRRAFLNSEVIQTSPRVFPLLSSLVRGTMCDGGGEVERPLKEWCGRALLESAMVGIANEDWGGG